MSPVVVRTFSTGPPPFSLPSALRVLGPHLSPSLAMWISGKSEVMWWPLAQVHAGADRYIHIGSNVDGDVARGGLQHGIVRGFGSGLHQLHRDSAGAGIGARRRHAKQFDPAAAGLRLDMPFAEVRWMLPPPVSISAPPPMSPRSMLPPPVDALTLPSCTGELQFPRRRSQCWRPAWPDIISTLPAAGL
jgi:hypothetical protein